MRPTTFDYIGLTWEEMPCWDLVVAWHEALGITLRPYTDYWMDGAPAPVGLTDWQRVDEPAPDDILVLNLTGRTADHVGVYLGGGKFLHSTEYAGVCVEQVERYKKRLMGFYRYVGDRK